MRAMAVVAVCVLLTFPAIAQTEIERTPVVGRFNGSVWAPIKTDGRGNIYVRMLSGDAPVNSPLMRISHDGTRVTRYSALSIPGSITTFLDFAPTASGELYAVAGCARAKGEPPCFLLARFNEAGKFVDAVRLDRNFIPVNFAAFFGGDFLIVVEDLRSGTKDKPLKTAALFGAGGQWIRNVNLAEAELREPEERRRTQPQPSPKGNARTPVPAPPKEEPLDIANVHTADDGSVYITRFSPLPAVFVVSPSGQAVRYELPQPEGQFKLHGATISDGMIIAVYDSYKSDPNREDVVYATASFCLLVDLASGTRLDRFPVTRLGMLVGAEGDALLYLVALPDGKLELQRAVMR